MHLQWVTVGSVDVDIGANPSAEEAEEGVDDSARKVVDIIDSFRLVVRRCPPSFLACLGTMSCKGCHVPWH